MSKSVLKVQYDYPFEVAGIGSNAKDYRLCHYLNTHLLTNFRKEEDLHIIMNKQGDAASFSFYVDDPYESEKHMIISNRGNNNWFFPEIKNVDYFYIVMGSEKWFSMEDLLHKLRQIEVVNGAYEIAYDKFKSRENLLFLV